MRSVKIEESKADKIKDLKKYLKKKEKLNTTEAELLSRAVDLSLHHYKELIEELKASKEKGIIQHVLENPEKGEKTNAATDHDAVKP